MSIPADSGRRRRTAIQWHDDGSVPRVPSLLSDDAPPYRALGLAALLGLVSIAAVVAVIQYQWQDGFPEVGPLVEAAQAGPATPPGKPQVTENVAPPAPAVEPPTVVAAADAGPVKPVAPAPKAAPAIVEAKLAAKQPAEQGGRVTAMAQGDAAEDEAIGTLKALAPLPKNDPRWRALGVTPGDPQKAAVAHPVSVDQPMALAPEEVPAAAPEPAVPRQKQVAMAAVAKPAKRAVEIADGGASSAKTRSAVFLRARPADGSKVLVTIPRGAKVQIASNCRHWCAVTYQGKSGFVYKSFVGR